jgi:hypothetical protein
VGGSSSLLNFPASGHAQSSGMVILDDSGTITTTHVREHRRFSGRTVTTAPLRQARRRQMLGERRPGIGLSQTIVGGLRDRPGWRVDVEDEISRGMRGEAAFSVRPTVSASGLRAKCGACSVGRVLSVDRNCQAAVPWRGPGWDVKGRPLHWKYSGSDIAQ